MRKKNKELFHGGVPPKAGGGIALQSQTSCLLLPGRLHAPRHIHVPDFFLKAYALALLQERSGSIPLTSVSFF